VAVTLRRAAPALLVSATAAASVALCWNLYYLGSLVGGGYAQSIPGALFSRSPLRVFFDEYLSQCALFVPLPVLLGLGALRQGRTGLRLLSIPIGLLLGLAGLFSVLAYSMGHEPVRRLAVVWLAWGFVVGRVWDRLRASSLIARGSSMASVLLGFYWFQLREWNYYYLGDDGSRLPLLQWLTWRAEGYAWWWLWPAALLGTALLAGAAIWRLLGHGSDAADGGRGPVPADPAGRATMP
jgi:hypothetical protein